VGFGEISSDILEQAKGKLADFRHFVDDFGMLRDG